MRQMRQSTTTLRQRQPAGPKWLSGLVDAMEAAAGSPEAAVDPLLARRLMSQLVRPSPAGHSPASFNLGVLPLSRPRKRASSRAM